MAYHQATLADPGATAVPRPYALVVFALVFGLLLSDYMSRQVLNAVFPLLKAEWGLSDAALGSLGSVVSFTVGLLAFPLSFLADRWGRTKSLTLMAVLWSLATLACALARNFEQMFAARFFIGLGEAAYGSVGVAVILSVFPAHLRATLTGLFLAGGIFGSVLGVALGGALAAQFGWRWSFAGMALFGLILAILYFLIVQDDRGRASRGAPRVAQRLPVRSIVACRSVVSAYLGSGLQLFINGALIAWMPSYLNRYYDMATGRAGGVAAILLLAGGLGMIGCGAVSDRLGRADPVRKFSLAIGFTLGSCIIFLLAFSLPPSPLQLALIAAGMVIATGTVGPAGAMVANLTPMALHGTSMATLSLANNLLGMAPGPFITGLLADAFDLRTALRIIPLVSLAAAAAFWAGKRHYRDDLARQAPTASE